MTLMAETDALHFDAAAIRDFKIVPCHLCSNEILKTLQTKVKQGIYANNSGKAEQTVSRAVVQAVAVIFSLAVLTAGWAGSEFPRHLKGFFRRREPGARGSFHPFDNS